MPFVRRALLSVSDKTGIAEFAKALKDRGVEIISTGGTAKTIAAAGVPVTKVAEVTGSREILDGRVKTLHPRIHGGLLARKDRADDIATIDEEGIATIDLLAVNLYPFEATVAAGADFATGIENIDIGGPAMIRAAAKNHQSVLVLTDPADYPAVLDAIDAGDAPAALRRRLAQKAFALTARYDAAIQSWLAAGSDAEPADLHLVGRHAQQLRYGENPHQHADIYLTADARPGVATARQHQGKPLSYNNLQDADAAFELVAEFERPTVAIIKHTNPCGAASAETLVDAYRAALAADPTSAFGGIVAMNRALDDATAGEITRIFTEVVIAPGASQEALARMATKPNLRLLTTDRMPSADPAVRTLRSIAGGILVQDLDQAMTDPTGWRVVTKRAPRDAERAALLFAWRVCKHTRSNAITIASGERLVGSGCGQTSRLDSVRLAATQARASGAADLVLASDAFFPFPDGLELAIEAGVVAVIQPGGSVKDDAVIAAADKAAVAMVFTGQRHFRH